MRVWVDPDKLAVRNLAVSDVIAAIREQNFQPAIGQVGAPPTARGQLLQIPLTIKGRLVSEEDFGNIIVRNTPDGRILRIRDIGYAELDARSQDINNRFDGKPTVGLAIWQLPDANALATADSIKSTMKELSEQLPEGRRLRDRVRHDPVHPRVDHTRCSHASATRILLVALVVLVFLQKWRAAVIPLLAVPVAIVGTFAAMYVVGFSSQQPDAVRPRAGDRDRRRRRDRRSSSRSSISIERRIVPAQAALKAMEEVSGPVIAVGLVLTAVFVPCTFICGIVGQFFRQFALTIAVSTVLSTINSLDPQPPRLAALLLRGRGALAATRSTWLLDIVARLAVPAVQLRLQGSTTSVYVWTVGGLLRVPADRAASCYVGLLGLTGWGYRQLPTGFIPVAGQGLPDRQRAAARRLLRGPDPRRRRPGSRTDRRSAPEAVKNVNSVAGQLVHPERLRHRTSGRCSSSSTSFDERRGPDPARHRRRGQAPRGLRQSRFPTRWSTSSGLRPVNGLGRAGGFKFMVEDRGDVGLAGAAARRPTNLVAKGELRRRARRSCSTARLQRQLAGPVHRHRPRAVRKAGGQPRERVRHAPGYPRFAVRERLQPLRPDLAGGGPGGLSIPQRNGGCRPSPGPQRAAGRWFRSARSPRSSWMPALSSLTRYNMYPAAAINGATANGFSTGQAIQALEGLVEPRAGNERAPTSGPS